MPRSCGRDSALRNGSCSQSPEGGSEPIVLKWFRRLRARLLTSRAFFLVEAGDYNAAVAVLRQATATDPTYGHAHNELAFVCGRKMRDLDAAEEAARRAVECDPGNVKFWNALNGVLLDRAAAFTTRAEVAHCVVGRVEEIDKAIMENPQYPPLRLAKATALALGGQPEEQWQAELEQAGRLYAGRSRAASGLPLLPGAAQTILANSRRQCYEMAKHWVDLPEA